MIGRKVHLKCFTAPNTYTACGLYYRDLRITNDPKAATCLRCLQINRLLTVGDKPPADTFKAAPKVKPWTRPRARVVESPDLKGGD